MSIYRCVQTHSNFDLAYEFLDEAGNIAAKASAPFQRGRCDVNIEFADGSKPLALYFNPSDTSRGSSMEARLSFYIRREGEDVGSLVGAVKKTGFLSGYPYYKAQYNGESFLMYAIGMRTKGLFIQIEDAMHRTVAMGRKDQVVIDYKDQYSLALEDDAFLPLAAAALVYLDITSYEDFESISLKSVKATAIYQSHKDLVAKFNHEFWTRTTGTSI